MKRNLIVLILLSLLVSCTHNGKKSGWESKSDIRIKKEAIDFASGYISRKLKEPVKKVSPDGIITIEEAKVRYIINPSKIYIGLIDDDSREDAIISVDYFNGQYLVLTDHLILINTDGKLTLNRELESDMRILGIKDRIITAEIYTKSRNSPLAGCGYCKEVVKYKLKSGDLIKTE